MLIRGRQRLAVGWLLAVSPGRRHEGACSLWRAMGLSHCTRALANSSNAWRERPGPAPSTLAASELARLKATRNSTSAIVQPCHHAFVWCRLTSLQWAAYSARHGYDHLILRERLVFSHE